MNRLVMLLLVASLFTLSGCAKTKFQVQQSNSNQVATYDEAQDYFIYGIAQEQNIDAARICGGADKVAWVETQYTVLNWLLEALTWGIYTPEQARVFCTL